MVTASPVRPPVQLVALIVALTVVPVAGLLWLGWRLFEQDRHLAARQAQDRVEHSADVVIAALQRSIAASEQQLAAGNDEWAEGAVALTFETDRVRVSVPDRIAYLPVPPALREVPVHVFAAGEELEFRRKDFAAAIRRYRVLAGSANPAVRAGALLRLARNLERTGRTDDALNAYGQLAEIEGVSELGFDVGIAALHERCIILERHGRTEDLIAQAGHLVAELTSDRRSVTAAQYALFVGAIQRWLGRPPSGQRQRETFADAAAILWQDWRSNAAGRSAPDRRTLVVNGRTLAVLWQPTAETGARALVATSAFVSSQWLAPVIRLASDQSLSVGLRDPKGGPVIVAGSAPPSNAAQRDGLSVHRTSSQAELPWNIMIASTATAADDGLALRWRLLASGFLLLVAMAAFATWLVIRAVSRELAVARLQSDFVAAVSHEFRTPLTTLRQFTDMLREQPRLDADRRALCYAAQARATERLTRLVESVLDFGRMEAGVQPYRLEPHDCTDLVRTVVEEFRAQPQTAGATIELEAQRPAAVRSDCESLSRAVWNLLDNAVKYSPATPHVRVDVSTAAGEVRIAVRDRGLGIPPGERTAIFAKFQRGEQARQRGINGTGLGLAMVDQIVRAHGGRIDVESEPGIGSTFTIVLPSGAEEEGREIQLAARIRRNRRGDDAREVSQSA